MKALLFVFFSFGIFSTVFLGKGFLFPDFTVLTILFSSVFMVLILLFQEYKKDLFLKYKTEEAKRKEAENFMELVSFLRKLKEA